MAMVVGGPVANLVLASGALSFLMIVMKTEPMLIGTTVFGLYFLGLGLIYLMMRSVVRLMGVARMLQLTILLVGVACLAFLVAHLA